ncbi:lysophospholipase [Rufibacter radiotolerans]|uniref:Lysophospholipase n=1 Tax=Rufibacter radiotolerans TaxID=1379910 RepID=A0A0H4VKW4_9BACT|nr:SGNH/GDSL hydrolase family protein [Rufibacter radiotolerans]AKQ46440.1 lysophospholipase [Rufibacter radiotolerans]
MEESNELSRRNFIKKTSLATVATLSMSPLAAATLAGGKMQKEVALKKNDIILFQGDSITDASRKKDDLNGNSPAGLGSGYAFLAAAQLLHQHAGKDLKIYNRGISGNKVYQLAERWEKEALDLKPNVLSLLIGVNDFWHMIQGKYSGSVKTYHDDYKTLLERTKEKLPDVKLIIGEPFAVPGIKAVDDKWFPAFNEYRQAAQEIATSFNAVFIPYQSIYEKAQKKAPGAYWTYDGVHPTLAGAQLMANAWLETIKG